MNWRKYEGNRTKNLPPEKRYVLVQILDGEKGEAPSVCVGYLKYAAGCEDSPYFVVPGVPSNAVCSPKYNLPMLPNGTYQCWQMGEPRTITHWCDCLGDDFNAPLWLGKQTK